MEEHPELIDQEVTVNSKGRDSGVTYESSEITQTLKHAQVPADSDEDSSKRNRNFDKRSRQRAKSNEAQRNTSDCFSMENPTHSNTEMYRSAPRTRQQLSGRGHTWGWMWVRARSGLSSPLPSSLYLYTLESFQDTLLCLIHFSNSMGKTKF